MLLCICVYREGHVNTKSNSPVECRMYNVLIVFFFTVYWSQLQHQQLLSLLGNAGSSTADASLAAKLQQQLQAPPTVQTPPIVQAPPTVKAPPPIAAQHQQQFTSDESLAPVSPYTHTHTYQVHVYCTCTLYMYSVHVHVYVTFHILYM